MADVPDPVDTWVQTGRKNPWIASAVDPPFNRESFHQCHSVAELKERVGRGNWCLGQAFHLGHLCLINQIDGGDEWLAVGTGDVGAFDSVTFGPSIREGRFEPLVKKLLAAARGSTAGYEYDVARQIEDGVRCAVCEEVFTPGDRVGFRPRPAMRAHPWDAEAERCVVDDSPGRPGALRGRRRARRKRKGERAVSETPELTVPADRVAAAVAALDANDARLGIDPHDAVVLRLGKLAEEYGEVWKALIGTRGQNPRKGRTHTDLDVVVELYDVALTALVAAASIPGGPPFRHADLGPHELWDCVTVLGARVGKTVLACSRGCADPHVRLHEVASRALSIAATIVGPGWERRFTEHVESRTARLVEAVPA